MLDIAWLNYRFYFRETNKAVRSLKRGYEKSVAANKSYFSALLECFWAEKKKHVPRYKINFTT